MKSSRRSHPFYNKAFKLIGTNDYIGAIKHIRSNLKCIEDYDELALAYLYCGSLENILRSYTSAMDDLSQAILYEGKSDFLIGRSKDISLHLRSDLKYKKEDYKGAIEDKRHAIKIRESEKLRYLKDNKFLLDYRTILLNRLESHDIEEKYRCLINISKIKKSKYDLIDDYKILINKEKRDELIRKLQQISDSKYLTGDFKGSIRAMRRAEKFY